MRIDLERLYCHLPHFFRRHKSTRLLLRLFPQSRIQLVRFNDNASLYADIADGFPRQAFLSRRFWPEYFKLAAPFLSEGGIYFDVGANAGFCTYGLIPSLKKRNVAYHLFEPIPALVDCLNLSRKLYPKENIFINSTAVGESNTKSTFYFDPNHYGNSRLEEGEISNLETNVTTLDTYISQRRITKVDFMKIDIEGGELGAFRGAFQTLRAGMIKAICFELSHEALRRKNLTAKDLFEELQPHGFQMFYLKPPDGNQEHHKKEFKLKSQTMELTAVTQIPSYDTDLLALHMPSFTVSSQ